MSGGGCWCIKNGYAIRQGKRRVPSEKKFFPWLDFVAARERVQTKSGLDIIKKRDGSSAPRQGCSREKIPASRHPLYHVFLCRKDGKNFFHRGKITKKRRFLLFDRAKRSKNAASEGYFGVFFFIQTKKTSEKSEVFSCEIKQITELRKWRK